MHKFIASSNTHAFWNAGLFTLMAKMHTRKLLQSAFLQMKDAMISELGIRKKASPSLDSSSSDERSNAIWARCCVWFLCVCSFTLARTCAFASMHLLSSLSSGCSRAVSLWPSLSAPPIVCLSVGYFPSHILSLSRLLSLPLLSLSLLLALSLLLVFLRPLFFLSVLARLSSHAPTHSVQTSLSLSDVGSWSCKVYVCVRLQATQKKRTRSGVEIMAHVLQLHPGFQAKGARMLVNMHVPACVYLWNWVRECMPISCNCGECRSGRIFVEILEVKKIDTCVHMYIHIWISLSLSLSLSLFFPLTQTFTQCTYCMHILIFNVICVCAYTVDAGI